MVNFFLESGMLVLILVELFVAGAVVGSFLNVGIARLSREKSIIWPNSRCGHCLQRIRWYDNLPLLSYWLLLGRCRTCKAKFSSRYFFVELLVAVAFPALFYLEVVRNIHDIPAFAGAAAQIQRFPFQAHNLPLLVFFLHHAILFSLLVAAAGCDLEQRSIPLPLTLLGTLVGLVLATLLPWPWPSLPADAMPRPRMGITEWWLLNPNEMQQLGLYPWPVWGPLPDWLPPGSWQLGLATGLAGALTGTFLLRGVKFLFETGLKKDALGLGDADLMMMVGAFLGWQPVLVAFLAGGVVALLLALPNVILRGENELPFGPGLAIGSVLTFLGWQLLGPNIQALMFHPGILTIGVLGCGSVVLILSFVFGRLRGAPSQP